MNIEPLDKGKDKLKFLVKDVDPSFVNALRRLIMVEVPTFAIEDVEFRKNTGLLYDEMLAHRLGLVALSTDLKSYDFAGQYEDVEDLSAKQKVVFTLKAKGPGSVHASDLKTTDPKVKPVFDKTLLVKLLKTQEVELEATAILGRGKDHMKWSPGLAFYSAKPIITVNNDNKDLEAYKDKYPSKIFDSTGKIDKKLILDNDLVDACAEVNNEIIKVEYEEKSSIFIVESFGQLSPKDMVRESCEILQHKSDNFAEKLKEIV
jgi:DNA-directed RNA polymerase subunit D